MKYVNLFCTRFFAILNWMKRFKRISLVVILAIVAIGVIYLVTTATISHNKDVAVVKQIRTLNRWETVSYQVEQIIDNGTSGNVFQQLLFGDRILLIAHGSVTAGFDLANLSEKSVHIQGKSIEISLPDPEILSTSLDESQTRVYDRQKGLLVPTNDNLESEARLSAINKIHQAACTDGVLQTASDNAQKQLTTMLQSLGFVTITITIPPGHC
jgi:Protein of unknown function (DUF4230)